MTPARIDRRFVNVGGRDAHYYRSGSGAPAVFIHPGMANAAFMAPLMRRFSSKYACFAFDNPGLGCSDPLPQPDVSMADFADALAAAMRALDFPKVPVFGTHTGGAIALELAVRHPDLVSGLIIDGLPIFTRDEVRRLYAQDYAAPLILDPLGGHYASTWTRFRDQGAYYPWYSKDPADLSSAETGSSAEATHSALTYFFRAADTYAPPFRAAHTFGEVAAARLSALDSPAIFMVASNDLLIRHINRFPRLKSNQALVRLGPDPEEKIALIGDYLARFEANSPPPADPDPPPSSIGITRRFIDLPSGQVLIRACGREDAPPLLLLHDAPGSAAALEPSIAALSLRHRVYAPDLPGSGESDALPGGAPSLADYAQAVITATNALGLEKFVAYGVGFGASLAILLASSPDSPVSRLALRGVLLPSADERADLRINYAPPIAIEPTGGHWYRTWLMLRDSLTYWPWYNRTRAGQRRIAADFGAARLHAWTFEVMKQFHAYHHLINAALDYDAGEALSRIQAPVAILQDPDHPFTAFHERLAAQCPAAVVLPPPADAFGEAEMIDAFLAR